MKPRTRFSRARKSLITTVTAVAAAAALAGCGSDTDDAAPPEGADAPAGSLSPTADKSEPASPTPAPTSEPTLEPTPEPTPEFTPLAPEDAADGTDVDACADGECEVAVTTGTTIPFDPDIGEVRIADVGESLVTLATTFSSGASGYTQAGIGPEAGSFGNVNTMMIDFAVLGIEDGTAVMSFVPREP